MSSTESTDVKPNNHMTLAVLAIIFFWPFALMAINYASHVNTLYASGDVTRAYELSRKAKKWAILSFVPLGVFLLCVFVAKVIV